MKARTLDEFHAEFAGEILMKIEDERVFFDALAEVTMLRLRGKVPSETVEHAVDQYLTALCRVEDRAKNGPLPANVIPLFASPQR